MYSVLPTKRSTATTALLASLVVLCLLGTSQARWWPGLATLAPPSTDSSRVKTLHVLFIGNSYTYYNNLPELLADLSASQPREPHIDAEMVVRGGATLRQHWEEGRALARLRGGHWDFVVLQEQSTLPITDPATMHKYARLFDAEIRRAGAHTVFFLTWARQDKPDTQAALNEAYTSIARELGAKLAPVGIAWQTALKRNPRLLLYAVDQSHPNASGSYLAACVLYSVIIGKSPEKLSSLLIGRPVNVIGTIGARTVELVKLNEKEASLLQQVAWDAASDQNDYR
jgi:hypothetical protein